MGNTGERELISKSPLGVGHLTFKFPPLPHPPPTMEGGGITLIEALQFVTVVHLTPCHAFVLLIKDLCHPPGHVSYIHLKCI